MFQKFLTKHRGWVIFLFAVPVSFLFQRILLLKNWYYRNFLSTNKLHNSKIKKIAEEIRVANTQSKQMCTARPTWQTMSLRKATYKDDCAQIKIDLKNILSFNKEKRTLRVEPMVTMGEITHYLIPKGFALSVQVEMDDLTVGGLAMGIGIETSSHKHGFLFETIKSYEIITASGNLVKASKDENPDLFHALPMSHGTLGFLVAVELEVIPVKKYMKLKYTPFHSLSSFSARLTELTALKDSPSFIEGLVFSNDTGVIMTGEFADKVNIDGRKNSINRWYKQWFYKHVETVLEKGETIEYIPLRHYFHRHTPSVFFQLRQLIPFANNAWYRWLFAWMGAPKISLMKYSMTKELRKKAFANRVTQDILVPIDQLKDAVIEADSNFGIYPLWICPVRIFNKGEFEGIIRNPKSNDTYEMYVDIGIYGLPGQKDVNEWNAVTVGRSFEHFTQKKNGFHMLYADIFMTKKEFETMFSHQHYRDMRMKYEATNAFPEVYNKVVPESWLIDLSTFEKEESPKAEEAVEI